MTWVREDSEKGLSAESKPSQVLAAAGPYQLPLPALGSEFNHINVNVSGQS